VEEGKISAVNRIRVVGFITVRTRRGFIHQPEETWLVDVDCFSGETRGRLGSTAFHDHSASSGA